MLKAYLKKMTTGYQKKSVNNIDFSFMPYPDRETAGVDSYKTNAIVHRCVSLIATSASHIPWQIFRNNQGDRELLKNHPSLNLLKNPSKDKSGADFFIESVSNLLLYGDSYMFISFEETSNPRSLYNLHPQSVEHVIDNGRIVSYNFGSFDKKQNFIVNSHTKKSRILHLKNYNPSDRQKGLSCLSAASEAVNLYSKIMNWNKSLLKNAIRPSGALVFQNGEGYLTDEQFERLQQQFYDNFSGIENSGKPLILEGGLSWQETSHSEKFEKFIELKDSSARDIAIAFNVPPQLLGISGDNTYSNMQEARLALWEENIIPLLDKYADALSTWFSYWYQEDLIVDFDKESISVLTNRRESLWSKISSADFMTINEKRNLVGLPPIEGGDRLNAENSGEDQ